MTGQTPAPGHVYAVPRPGDNPEQLLVVLSDEDSNEATGYTTVCRFTVATESRPIAGIGPANQFYTMAPTLGLVMWPLHYAELNGALTDYRGDVESTPLIAARTAMAARFSRGTGHANEQGQKT